MSQILYTYAQAAEQYGCSESQMRTLVRTKTIPAYVAPGTKNSPCIKHEDLVEAAKHLRPYQPTQRTVA